MVGQEYEQSALLLQDSVRLCSEPFYRDMRSSFRLGYAIIASEEGMRLLCLSASAAVRYTNNIRMSINTIHYSSFPDKLREADKSS